MIAPQFTPEEKRILYRILARPSRGKDGFFFYAVFIFPSLIIAVYGVWNSDFAATLVAYGALLFVVLTYLIYTHGDGQALYSAITKYEKSVGALINRGEREG